MSFRMRCSCSFIFSLGDYLKKSIKEKLFVLPDYVKVYSGHGQPTEIGFEKENNMYINV